MLPRVLAIVPVKGRDGKNRLDRLLGPDERARLVEAMLADVVAACRDARSVERTMVVTPDPEAAPADVDVLEDDGRGHSAAVGRALGDERARDGVVVVMGDCPLVTGELLDRLVAAADPVALAPAADGGVNALALRDPAAIEPPFGVSDAARDLLGKARAAGIAAAVVEEPELAFDVDKPSDVWRLRQDGGPTRTHRVLEEMLPPTGGLL